MTQTQSFKDKLKQAFSFFLWELKSCSGTLTIYSILTGVFMVVILTLCLSIGGMVDAEAGESIIGLGAVPFGFEDYDINNAMDIAKIVFQKVSVTMICFMTIIFTVIYTIKVFGYLHNKRQADMYGSMPISRVTLFLSKSASALIFSVVPAIIFMMITACISLILGKLIIMDIVTVCINLVIGTLACIVSYGLIAVCCGTTLNSVIIFITVCIAYPVAAFFIKGVAGGFFYGFYTAGISDSFVMHLLNPVAAYEGTNIVYWLIFTAVCAVGAVYLVKNRKAERAQSSFAYYLPCHIIKVLVSFVFGMFLGVMFGSLNVFRNGIAGFAFGFVIASFTAFLVAHLIFYRGFSGLIKTSIPLVVLIVVTMAAILFCNFDVFGYNKTVPKADDVKSAGLIDSEYCYMGGKEIDELIKQSGTDFTDKDTIEKIIEVQNNIIDNASFTSNQKFANVWINIFGGALNVDSYDFTGISYKMNNGKTMTRFYSNVYSIWDDSQFYSEKRDNSIADIAATKEYQIKYSGMMNVVEKDISDVSVWGEGDAYKNLYDNIEDKKPDKVMNILEAYRKEFENDTTSIDTALYAVAVKDGQYDDYLFDHIFKECPDAVCVLEISVMNDGFYGKYTTEYFVVPKSYTNTIKALKEAGALDDELNVIYDDYGVTDDIDDYENVY